MGSLWTQLLWSCAGEGWHLVATRGHPSPASTAHTSQARQKLLLAGCSTCAIQKELARPFELKLDRRQGEQGKEATVETNFVPGHFWSFCNEIYFATDIAPMPFKQLNVMVRDFCNWSRYGSL
jgi:hypothetical protein